MCRLRGLRIAVIDGSPSSRAETTKMLRAEGAGLVVDAPDSVAAEAILRSEPIDAAVIELLLPDGSGGFSLSRRLSEIKPAMKVLLTAELSVEHAAKLADAVPFLRKPFQQAICPVRSSGFSLRPLDGEG